MLDQQHGHVLDVADAADLALQDLDLIVVQAGRRLVEQQQLGAGGQRARQLDTLADRERQRPGQRVNGTRSMNSISSSARAVMRRSSSRPCGSRMALSKKLVPLRLWQPTLTLSSTDMRSNSATFWKVRPMPMCGMSWRGRFEDRLALEQHVAAVRRVEAAQAVEEGRLAGAVGADQAGDLAGKDIEGYAIERHDAAEANRDVADAQQAAQRG